jgi:hypothetical protein
MKDKKRTNMIIYFGALKTTLRQLPIYIKISIGSVFHTLEQEHFDISASIPLGEVDSNIGSETYGDVALLEGLELNHARNDLMPDYKMLKCISMIGENE